MTDGPRRALLLALVVGALYANTLGNDFVWDDRLTAITAEPAASLGRRTGSFYRPIVMLSFALDRAVWGLWPAGFHLTNVVLHGTVAWLLGALAVRLGLSAGAALAAALVFAAHPVQTEAVTYISGRTDVLGALFVLLALLAWRRARAAGDRFALASGAALAAALLCKESVVLVPLLLLVPTTGAPRPVVPLTVAVLWLVLWQTGGGPPLAIDGLAARLPAIGATALGYLRLLCLPVGLHLERFTAVPGWSIGAALVVWALLGVTGAGLAWLSRRVVAGRFLLALAVLLYLPVAGIVPIHAPVADRVLFAAEHFLYLPLLGLAPLVAGAAARAPRPLALLALGVLLPAWGALVIDRNRDWRDEAALFRHTLAYEPPAARVWFNLGNLELAAGNLAEAARLYEASLARAPNDAAVHFNLGIVRQRQGDPAAAEASWRRALELDPRLRAGHGP